MAQISACLGRETLLVGTQGLEVRQLLHHSALIWQGGAFRTFLTLQQPRLTFASSDGGFSIAYVHLSSFPSLQKACSGAGGRASKRSDL